MTSRSAVRILRIRREANLLTARAYEDVFDRQLGAAFNVTIAPLEAWCDAILGPVGTPYDPSSSARRFAEQTAGQDFFCPNYECMALTSVLLAARNASRSRVRLLFISHAAGAYSFEWALMRPLLAVGDVIIAPSESARQTILFLCPELGPFVTAIPHPMEPLGPIARRSGPTRVVSLGRVHAEKLIHRQIEAMAILCRRRTKSLHMEIGGPLADGGWEEPHPYTRALREKTRRLGLESQVTFVGPVRGDEVKRAFLGGAAALINLSITVEESCPKAPIEALGTGVPVVGTDWNGLRDTVGALGVLVPVVETGEAVGGVDVDAARVADAIEALLDAPPPSAQCMAWVEQFAPWVILPRYRETLETGVASAVGEAWRAWPDASHPAAPMDGLLASAAPLSAYSWRELFDVHLSWCDSVRRGWATGGSPDPSPGSTVRGVVLAAVEPSLKRFFGRLPPMPSTPVRYPSNAVGQTATLADRLSGAGNAGGLLAGRAACLAELIAGGQLAAANAVLASLVSDGLHASLESFWRAEHAIAAGEPRAALEHSVACVSSRSMGESDWPLIRQLARSARRAERPASALPQLLDWLDRFPDSQESGPVWLDACVNSLRDAERDLVLTERYHARARALLGDMPIVRKCGARIASVRRERMLVA